MQGLNPITMQCTYSTPCGWCTKWDKKCDKKISAPTVQHYEITNKICKSEEDHQWECCGVSTIGISYRCKNCGAYKTVPNGNYAENKYEYYSTK